MPIVTQVITKKQKEAEKIEQLELELGKLETIENGDR